MELIKVDPKGGVAEIKFEITGLMAWRYRYVCDAGEFKKNSNDPPPYSHVLGLPAQLNQDIDSWTVFLANVGNADAKYSVTLTWTQTGKILHQWKKAGKVAPNKLAQLDDDAWLVVHA